MKKFLFPMVAVLACAAAMFTACTFFSADGSDDEGTTFIRNGGFMLTEEWKALAGIAGGNANNGGSENPASGTTTKKVSAADYLSNTTLAASSASETDIDGFFALGPSTKVRISGSAPKIRFAMNGTCKTASDYIKFTTTGAATVTVNFYQTKGERKLVILDSSGTAAATGTVVDKSDGTVVSDTLKLSSAGTYYLGALASGIYIIDVSVTF